jgi:hypothetical protein
VEVDQGETGSEGQALYVKRKRRIGNGERPTGSLQKNIGVGHARLVLVEYCYSDDSSTNMFTVML